MPPLTPVVPLVNAHLCPSDQWPGPRGPGIKQSTRLLVTSPDQSLLSALLVTMTWQWLLWTDPSHLRTRPHLPAPPSELLLLLKSKSKFVGASSLNGREGAQRPPSSVGPFCRQTRFLFFLFFSHCQIQFCTQFTSSFFSSPPLFFGQRQKKVEQRRPSFKPNHSPTLGRMNCLLYIFLLRFSSFQLELSDPSLSHSSMEHVREAEQSWGPIKQLSSLLVN